MWGLILLLVFKVIIFTIWAHYVLKAISNFHNPKPNNATKTHNIENHKEANKSWLQPVGGSSPIPIGTDYSKKRKNEINQGKRKQIPPRKNLTPSHSNLQRED